MVSISDFEKVIASWEYISTMQLCVLYNISNYILISNYQCFNFESNPSI